MELFPQTIKNKFTSHLKNVIKNAEDISRDFSHEFIDVEHILFGIISQKGSIGSNVISQKLNLKALRKIIENLPRIKNWEPKLSEEVKSIFKKSIFVAGKYKNTYVGTEHLFYSLLSSNNERTKKTLSLIEIDKNKLAKQLESIIKSSSRFFDIVKFLNVPTKSQKFGPFVPQRDLREKNLPQENEFIMEIPQITPQTPGLRRQQSALDYFCVDLVEEFEKGNVDPVIGRKNEIEKVINILSRKTKNNPILIGEPGVGKSAIVYGIAQRISEGNISIEFINKRIYYLDICLLVAGAVFRGEFEGRLKDVISEVEENPNAILFIDEIHNIIGAGSVGGSGSLDAANILKPSLSRGSISCIGATTLNEYRKHFRKDAAMERRFQAVLVEEPSIDDTKEILRKLKKFYEKHHGLKITEEAIDSAVELSYRFINDRFFPDKAIDVLDEAFSFVKSRHSGKNYFKEIRKLEKKRVILQSEKEKAVENEQYDKAIMIRKNEKEIENRIVSLYKIQNKEIKKTVDVSVNISDIAEIVSQTTGIPVKKLESDEKENLKNLKSEIKKRIIGQDEAVSAVSKSIYRSRSGISDTKRPIGIFMFLGPSGVGKTELARVLAEKIYEDKNSIIKVDMSEFMERHNVSRLIGAPAGYVGYEEGGKLTEQVRLKPYSIILFDEIEKAHPDVFNIMLQIFEDGELTDAAGRKTDFRNTIIIMTSNFGTEQLTYDIKYGFGNDEKLSDKRKKEEIRKRYIETKNEILKDLKNEFKTEFINRIDKIIIFNPLSISDIKSITNIQLNDFKKRMLKNNINVDFDKKAIDYISRMSFDPNEGARLVRRNIQEMVEDLISEKIINGEIKTGDGIKIKTSKGEIIIEK